MSPSPHAAPTSRLYFRSAWQKALDDNKIDIGLMARPDQDDLDRDLVLAVTDQHHRGISEMIALGANVNRRLLAPVDGTLLHLAVTQGSIKTLILLLRAGADPALASSVGETVYDLATRRQREGHAGSGRLRTVLKLWESRLAPARRAA